MPKYPVISSAKLIKILMALGFSEIRQKGSHKQFRNQTGLQTTVPVHKGRDISPILLRQILKEIDLDLDEFNKYL